MITLYKAIGPGELDFIRENGNRKFNPGKDSLVEIIPIHLYSDLKSARKLAIEMSLSGLAVGYVVEFGICNNYFNKIKKQNISKLGGYDILFDQFEEFHSNMKSIIYVVERYSNG